MKGNMKVIETWNNSLAKLLLISIDCIPFRQDIYN